MKARHVDTERVHARATLAAAKIPLGADFHTLSSTQVAALLVEAGAQRYQKPKSANGSRARYFHDLMQRRAVAYLPYPFQREP
jgi:hypothetical protein